MSKLILDHIARSVEVLKGYSRVIALTDHRTNIGTAREALISNFLALNLPPAIKYYNGEAFDSEGKRSGQIDILLAPDSSPRLHMYGAINLLPIDTIFCAVEVKSSLKGADDIGSVLDQSKKFKSLKKVNSRFDIELKKGLTLCCSSVPYVIFVYDGTNNCELFYEQLNGKAKSDGHLGLMPDVISVMSGGYSLIKTTSYRSVGCEAKEAYAKIDNPLLPIYDFLISMVEHWATNPGLFAMPLKAYTEESSYSGLYDFHE